MKEIGFPIATLNLRIVNGEVRDALCPKGTFLGAAAEASPYGFAVCRRPADHGGDCDSGPEPEESPDAD